MKTLPPSPDLSHLKKQAKTLLRAARAGEAEALRHFAEQLPAARALTPAQLPAYPLHLHDAQSVIARDYGYRSWTELKRAVEWLRASLADQRLAWLRWALDGNARERALAVRMLAERPGLLGNDPWFACVTGGESILRDTIAQDPDWVNRPSGPRNML